MKVQFVPSFLLGGSWHSAHPGHYCIKKEAITLTFCRIPLMCNFDCCIKCCPRGWEIRTSVACPQTLAAIAVIGLIHEIGEVVHWHRYFIVLWGSPLGKSMLFFHHFVNEETEARLFLLINSQDRAQCFLKVTHTMLKQHRTGSQKIYWSLNSVITCLCDLSA